MIMGRTIPSFRIALGMEKAVWKPFRNALSKSEKKQFDEMWDVPRLYLSACSNSAQLVPLHPIIISILFHHYKELKECINQVEEVEDEANKVNNNSSSSSSKQRLIMKEVKREETSTTATLDSCLMER
jgi:hypothetical protein